jgi:type IX secretion system PorP/SprF family membrane protein
VKLIIFLSIFVFPLLCGAQNTARFSQLNFAQGVLNPASIAFEGKIMADIIFRNQWLGVEGAPTTVALNAQYEINQSVAGGLNICYDGIGAYQTTSFSGQYSYRLNFEGGGVLALGIGLGLDNEVNNLGASSVNDINDPAFASSYTRIYFNSSFGLYYTTSDFYIGASIPKLFQNTSTSPDRGFRPPRWHYYLSSGFYLDAGENFTFNPHFQIKYSLNTPMQGDLILRNTLYRRFSICVGYRSENAVIAGFDVLINPNARIGYSFNYNLGKFKDLRGISNELYLGFAFPYNSFRNGFASRKYVGKKGGHKFNFRKNSSNKGRRSGKRYGRNTKYR